MKIFRTLFGATAFETPQVVGCVLSDLSIVLFWMAAWVVTLVADTKLLSGVYRSVGLFPLFLSRIKDLLAKTEFIPTWTDRQISDSQTAFHSRLHNERLQNVMTPMKANTQMYISTAVSRRDQSV
jgi:hypothetical protein